MIENANALERFQSNFEEVKSLLTEISMLCSKNLFEDIIDLYNKDDNDITKEIESMNFDFDLVVQHLRSAKDSMLEIKNKISY